MLENAYNTSSEKGFYFPGRILSGAGSRNKIPELIRGKGPIIAVTDALFAADPLLEDLNPVRRITRQKHPTLTILFGYLCRHCPRADIFHHGGWQRLAYCLLN